MIGDSRDDQLEAELWAAIVCFAEAHGATVREQDHPTARQKIAEAEILVLEAVEEIRKEACKEALARLTPGRRQ